MTELARAVEPARSRRIVSWSIGLAAVLATAAGMKLALAPAPKPPPPPPKQAAPTVVPIPAPQLVVVQPPAPPAPPPPEAPVQPEPRALAPVIRPECIGQPIGIDGGQQCYWDSGFPAISADGATVASAFVPWEEERGASGLIVRLVDVASGKTVRTLTVLDAYEYVDPGTPAHDRMRSKIDRRAIAAQRVLDAGGYRAMTRLEPDDPAMRVIDAATNTVLWQHRFDVAREFPRRTLDGTRCEPTKVGQIEVGWDPQTRTLLAHVAYSQDAEHCSYFHADYTHRVKP